VKVIFPHFGLTRVLEEALEFLTATAEIVNVHSSTTANWFESLPASPFGARQQKLVCFELEQAHNRSSLTAVAFKPR